MVNDLKVKGLNVIISFYQINQIVLEEIYNVFIGPYENEEETNQWAKKLRS